MKRNSVLLGMTIAAIATNALAAKPAPVFDVNSNSNYSSNSNKSVEERISTLERKLEARNRAQVRVQRQLDELQNEVNELRGITEQHTHQLGQVLNRQRELYQELDRRVSEALKPAKQVPAAIVAPENNTVASNYSSDLTENEAYDHAVNLVLQHKKYDEAIPAFRSFNDKYPSSSYAANAHYWLGQLLFNKSSLAEAQSEFETVVNNYPDSSKRSDAMLKLAMVAQKQNSISKAVSLYKSLISEYPNSSAAQLAQPRLESLQ